MSDATNATFHSFKQSGKWYATDRGLLTADVFAVFETSKRRARIVAANGGRYPGLNSAGDEYIFVVVADDAVDFGYPLMLKTGDMG